MLVNKYRILFTLIVFITVSKTYSQTNINNIKKVNDNFYLMYIDSSNIKHNISKSAIIEFNDFLVISELPLAYSNSNLSDHILEGENVIATLKEYFHNKPIKYIVSSHWHPHSISAIEPFISKGATLITTKTNFEILKPIIDSSSYEKYGSNIKTMTEDSLVISDKSNKIVLYKVNNVDYTYLPTDEFIYTYLPKIKYFQTSCMYQRFPKSRIRGKELISGRVEDLNSFIKSHNLNVEKLLCTENYFDDYDGLISNDTLNSLMSSGIGMLEIEKELTEYDANFIKLNLDSLGKEFIEKPIPKSIFIRAIITLIKKNNLDKVLEISKLLAFINPSDASSWDALGESYYLLGESEIAKHYEKQSLRIDPNFKGGGESAWELDRLKYLINKK